MRTKKLREKKKFWDRRINIAHRKINRKKYYGLGVEIENYTEAVKGSVNTEEMIKALKSQRQEKIIKEGFIDKLMSLLSVTSLDSDNQLFASISGIFSDSFKKGTRRLFTKKGNRVDVDQFVNDQAISKIMNKQNEYFEKLHDDLQNKVRDTLKQGLEEGSSMTEIANNIEKTSENFTENRAKTVARSEVIKASSQGTEDTMRKAGIEKFMWLSARNDNVCESGNFHESFNGKTFTSCREYDGTTWHIDGLHPVPVQHSHPNCRCTLVAETE